MTLQEFSLLLISILISVAGQFFLKMGAIKLGKVHVGNAVNHILSIITTPELLIGLTCYAIGAVVYILLLTRVNLSVAAPSVSISYIFSVLLGYLIFKESIPHIRLVGLTLIVLGVILVVWRK
ncbi:EamA family transporter [Nostocaceae cyanobacterium CENA357]|uniref:EamA family transporter n=1 Tax=Atlanticothrix silvestris CENA357 TaxID=1725252 RepID=A0A8J7HDC0_9CYAN|nr:EamA family transporter [Atlanticothrix silvestris]MBH8553109.1 EamA family transporter [Atlanticothrix silvestris CENA357]